MEIQLNLTQEHAQEVFNCLCYRKDALDEQIRNVSYFLNMEEQAALHHSVLMIQQVMGAIVKARADVLRGAK